MIVRPGDTVVLAFDMKVHSDDLLDILKSLNAEIPQDMHIKVMGVSGLFDSFIIRSDET